MADLFDDKLNDMLTPIESQKTYLRIVEMFINSIAGGSLQYGSRLYNEAELMAALNVSRSTLREALRVMEFLDIVTIRPRKGIQINNPNEVRGYTPLMYQLMFERISSMELFEMRRAIQTEMVGGAAQRRSAENLAELQRINQLMTESRDGDYLEFGKYDYAFHMQIVICSENQIGIKMMHTLGTMLQEQLLNLVRDFPKERRDVIVDSHTQILSAVEQQDPAKAKMMMQEHLDRPYRTIKNQPAKYFVSGRHFTENMHQK